MAFVNNGTRISIATALQPSDLVAPAVTTFSDEEYIMTKTLTILKATVANADHATTITNIISNATIGIEKQVLDLLTADVNSTLNTVTYWIDWKSLRANDSPSRDSDFLTSTATSYIVLVDVYVKTVVI